MKRITELEKALKDVCQQPTALWLSGGKDSLLLFLVMKRLRLPFSVLRFDDAWSSTQKRGFYKLISKHHTPLYSYPPTNGYLVGDGKDEITFVAHYPVTSTGETMVIIRDLIENSDRCAFDINIRQTDRIKAPITFARHILGSKEVDRHYLYGDKAVVQGDCFLIRDTQFYIPLYRWTDGEVLDALRQEGAEGPAAEGPLNTGNIPACRKCLMSGKGQVFCPKTRTMIDRVEWEPEKKMNQFRTLMGVNVK